VLIRTLSTSRQWRLAARPAGKIRKSDFELVEVPIPEPDDGQFVVAVTHISLDPAMRLERLFTGENTGKLVLELQQ
jgi:NADPH-dependent curcumin reductase CurA